MTTTLSSAAVFVDVQNIYYTCREGFNRQFNYRQFLKWISAHYKLDYSFAYAIASQDDGQHKFQKALRHMGFEVKLKPHIQRRDGSAKGDWDVGITLDVMEYAENVQHIFLLSGDGDFDLLLARASQRFDVVTHVMGVESLTASSLMMQCDHFYPISKEFLL